MEEEISRKCRVELVPTDGATEERLVPTSIGAEFMLVYLSRLPVVKNSISPSHLHDSSSMNFPHLNLLILESSCTL